MKPIDPRQLENARLSVLEMALITFIEGIDGHVPTDEEIIREGCHVNFADTSLARFTRDNLTFTRYYVWRRQHVVALGFISPKSPAELSIAQLHRADWPPALCAFIGAQAEESK